MRLASIIIACAMATSSSHAGDVQLASELVVDGLDLPTFATHAPGDTERLFILEKRGRIRIYDLTTETLLATPFLDIDSLIASGTSELDERGLLGLAFHPQYETNGFFYVNYTDDSDDTVVARYTVGADPDVADPGSAQTVIAFDQPFINHNGGWIEFGPSDGYLYISAGDGGAGNDPFNNAQDIEGQRLGKLLRLDVDGDDFPAERDRNYAIPPTNPFVGITGDDEIWAYGLRNAWRCAFDENGDLYIADVGQSMVEEINVQPASSLGGENYGWRCMEGDSCTGLPGCTCFDASLTLPVHTYGHDVGCSITGGFVYRGAAIAAFDGAYIFADYCSGAIWSFVYDGAVTEFVDRTAELDPPGVLSIDRLGSFGRDGAGELYMLDHEDGEIFRIVEHVPLGITLSEVRSGGDDEEYVEISAEPGTPLDDITYVAIGDADDAGSGVIEEAVTLAGQVAPPSGYYVIAEPSFSLGTANLVVDLNLEDDDNVTHMLVAGFSGAVGDDLDTDDDGVFDVEPWTQVVDRVAMIVEHNPPATTEYHYGPPAVGPDGLAAPAHVFRCFEDSVWVVGDASPGARDTPGAENETCVRILVAAAAAHDDVFLEAVRSAIPCVVDAIDVIDTRSETPDGETLETYELVATWALEPYADPITFGDRLASYVDAGGCVVLGAGAPAALGGTIMDVGYAPVEPAGGASSGPIDADAGTTCIFDVAGVVRALVVDDVTLRAGAVADGGYDIGGGNTEIAAAYNGPGLPHQADRQVVFLNGFGGGAAWDPTGDIASWLAAVYCGCHDETCPWDLNENSMVDSDDMLLLIGAWGPCSPCQADFDVDGIVGITDILELFGAWGPCD